MRLKTTCGPPVESRFAQFRQLIADAKQANVMAELLETRVHVELGDAVFVFCQIRKFGRRTSAASVMTRIR